MIAHSTSYSCPFPLVVHPYIHIYFYLNIQTSIQGVRFDTSSVEWVRRLTLSSFRTMKCIRCCFSVQFGLSKNIYCGKHLRVHEKWPKLFGTCVTKDICAFTHEHPGTRRCTIHPCTLTTTLAQKHNKSLQFRNFLDQSRNCSCLLSRVSGCALLNKGMMAALGRRWTWRLWRALCRRASRRVPSPRTVKVAKQQCSSTCCGPQARRSAPRYDGGVSKPLITHIFSGRGRRNNSTLIGHTMRKRRAQCHIGPILSHFHDTSLSGRV